MSRIRWLLWLCCAWPCAAQLQTSKVWRMDRAAPATNPASVCLQFAVLTATQTQQDLILRVGVFNGKAEPLTGSAPVLAEHFTLSAMTDGDITRIQPTTATLTDMFGQGTLPAHSVHTGLLTFAWATRGAAGQGRIAHPQRQRFQPLGAALRQALASRSPPSTGRKRSGAHR